MAEAGYKNVVCADVGGTTYDVGLIHDGEIVERSNTIVAGRPVMGSVIDVISVGAGGGSIATIDKISGSLRVGPESAGAQPGPACFGIGGENPTVTDAQVVLNLLDPERFLGSRMFLDRSLAEKAIRNRFGEDRDVVLLADGIVTIAQTNMANAIRQITTQRGLDPREFAMLSYGGGGGLFAAGVAKELGIGTVIIPQSAAGFSAWGMLTADYREDSTITSVMDVMDATLPDILTDFSKLAAEAKSQLLDYGFADELLKYGYSADVRFAGQEHTITTPVDPEWLEDGGSKLAHALQQRFVDRHRQRYGHGESDAAIQIVTARCRAIAPVTRPNFAGEFSESEAAPVAFRMIWFPEEGWHEQVPVYERADMSLIDSITGPAVVDEWTTTVIVPPRWTATLDSFGNLVMTFEEAEK
jgi:N-methylhydantoinase A